MPCLLRKMFGKRWACVNLAEGAAVGCPGEDAKEFCKPATPLIR